MIKDIIVFSLTSSIELTNKVCALLGIERSKNEILHFADGECLATSSVDVRGKKVYIIQSTCKPVNETLMELVFGYEDDALINADDTINVSYVDPSVIRVMLSNIDFENPQNN